MELKSQLLGPHFISCRTLCDTDAWPSCKHQHPSHLSSSCRESIHVYKETKETGEGVEGVFTS